MFLLLISKGKQKFELSTSYVEESNRIIVSQLNSSKILYFTSHIQRVPEGKVNARI
jgi:hypothetical protein